MKRRVVVTGLGLICGVGHTAPEVWAGLLAGKSGRPAFWTAVNIDGLTHKKGQLQRGRDSWYYDPRVPKPFQVGDGQYAGSDFDIEGAINQARGKTFRPAGDQ